MAWARRTSDNSVVHVSMLSRAQTGQACGCVCAGCGAPLQAVNAGQDGGHFQRPRAHRMSFRHQPGMQRSDCADRASRSAIVGAWIQAGAITLPERRETASFLGASGAEHGGEAVQPSQTVGITAHRWVDAEAAMITLADGRQVLISLRADVVLDDGVHAVLVVATDDPEVAAMSQHEVLARAKLLIGPKCWVRHWDDEQLSEAAHHRAVITATERMDALPTDGEFGDEPFAEPEFLESLDPVQRGETLLHLHLKQLLARVGALEVPVCTFPVRYQPPAGGQASTGAAVLPAVRLLLSNARLEQHLGDIVPDVLCDAQVEGELLQAWPLMLEVAVTHRVGAEKLARIQARDTACLELDAKRLAGGQHLTVEQLSTALLNPPAGALYWVFHPDLSALLQREEDRLAAEHVKQQKLIAESRVFNAKLSTRLDDFERRERALQFELSGLRKRLSSLSGVGLLRSYVNALAARPHDGRPWDDRQHQIYSAALSRGNYASAADSALQPVLLALHSIHQAGAPGGEQTLVNVPQLLQGGLTDPLLRPYMPVLLRATKHYCLHLMAGEARAVVKGVSQQVWDDIQAGSRTFTRELVHDGALALLFPELRDLLWPCQPGTLGFANEVRFKQETTGAQAEFQREVVREPVPPHVVEAALGPARARQWTRGGGVPFEGWSRFADIAKLPKRHQRTVRLAYNAREAGTTVLDFVRSQEPRSEIETLICLETLAGVFLLA